jgi:hypothetical protein
MVSISHCDSPIYGEPDKTPRCCCHVPIPSPLAVRLQQSAAQQQRHGAPTHPQARQRGRPSIQSAALLLQLLAANSSTHMSVCCILSEASGYD